MIELPGNLRIVNKRQWRELLLRSEVSNAAKVAAILISETARYNKKTGYSLTSHSVYLASTYLKLNSEETIEVLKELTDAGWLHDTGIRHGARLVHILTVNVEPERMKH